MEIRTLKPADIDRVAQVERTAWGDMAATPDTIRKRARVFEDGSIVAVQDGEIQGYAAAQLTRHLSTGTWAEQTDDGALAASHVPDGRLAYGVSMSAMPGVKGEGVAFHVVAHYARIFLGTGRCSALCVGSRLPGFARWKKRNGSDAALADYVQPSDDGRPRDPELRLYASNGFNVLWELPDYFPDAESLNHGAMVIRTTL